MTETEKYTPEIDALSQKHGITQAAIINHLNFVLLKNKNKISKTAQIIEWHDGAINLQTKDYITVLPGLGRGLKRLLLNELETTLSIETCTVDNVTLKPLVGKLIKARIERITNEGIIAVLVKQGIFGEEQEIVRGSLPIRHQPPHERPLYKIGQTIMVLVQGIKVEDRTGLLAMVPILSRTSATIPAMLLRTNNTEATIKCIKRFPGRRSDITTNKRLSRESILKVCEELKERIYVKIS